MAEPQALASGPVADRAGIAPSDALAAGAMLAVPVTTLGPLPGAPPDPAVSIALAPVDRLLGRAPDPHPSPGPGGAP